MDPVYVNPKNLTHRSDSASYNGIVFLAGVMPRNGATADMREQTKDVLVQIDEMLAAAGTDKSRLLWTNIWLADPKGDIAAFNEVWNAWVVPGRQPARAAVQSAFQIPGLLEVAVTAAGPA